MTQSESRHGTGRNIAESDGGGAEIDLGFHTPLRVAVGNSGFPIARSGLLK
jgi:hypothetical protein